MKTKYLALVLLLGCASPTFAVLKEVGEGIDAVGRGVGKGVKRLPLVGDLLGGQEGVVIGGAQVSPSKNIAENLMASKSHTKLVSALQTANLTNVVGSLEQGPYTVFAPTDEAFAKIGASPSNEDLNNILLSHVIPGVITTRYLRDGQTLTAVNGQKLSVTLKDVRYLMIWL